VGLEGELRVRLGVNAGRVDKVGIESTRPDVAHALLRGRTRTQIAAAVPLLFSICGRSQAAASELACAAATGEPPSAPMRERAAAAVAAEIVREGAWRVLFEWPRWLGETPDAAAVAAVRSASATAIAQAAFGVPATEWLALQSRPELERWAAAGGSASARFIHRLRDDDDTTSTTPLLDSRSLASDIELLAQALDGDPGFASRPTWHDAPAETGALARLRNDPLVADYIRSGSHVAARFVARLREVALLLAQRGTAQVGAVGGQAGGIGWVDGARGLLVHRVRFDGPRAERYDIVAPTEWNFHPRGALAVALQDAPAGDLLALRARATRLVNSLDPCVGCRIEFDDA